jgi:Spy/CpxP family protein refolding chaperone
MKTKMQKLGVVALGLSAFVMLSGFHSCHRSPMEDPERAKKYADMFIDDKLDDLKATPAQRTQIHQVANDLYPDILKLHVDQKAAREQALVQLESNNPDATKLHGLVDERIDAVRVFAHKVVDAVIKVHQTLTPEQRKEVLAQAKEHME